MMWLESITYITSRLTKYQGHSAAATALTKYHLVHMYLAMKVGKRDLDPMNWNVRLLRNR